MGHVLLLCSITVWVYMSAWFVLALLKKDNSLADIAWGLGFVLLAGLTLGRRSGDAVRPFLVSGLVLIWGIRLALHIFTRNRKRGEDFRYAEWRAKWGRSFVLRSYLQVFILQGIFLLIISLPVVLINASPEQKRIGLLDLTGAFVWLAGFVFECVGDWQLARFKRDPADKTQVMTKGLWKYTRHPNYFGEAVMWWGLFLLALQARQGWLAVASPLLITFLLLRVSGVPMLEKKYAGNAEFQEYARRTNVFIPWFPKKVRGMSARDIPPNDPQTL
jgi:steroid 5-alpha reductase family enzyme